MKNAFVPVCSVRVAVALSAIAGGWCCGDAVAQVSVNLPSVADNTLYEQLEGNLSNAKGPTMFVGTTGTGSRRRSLIRFDTTSIPAGATITGVEMRLFMSRTTSGPEPVSLHRALASWGEGSSSNDGAGGSGAPSGPGDATWIHRFYDSTLWTTAGGDFAAAQSASTSVGGNGTYSWASTDMIADVQSWLLDPSTNFGWLLLGDEGAAGTAKRFQTRESVDGTQAPVLTVTYVPAPTGVCAAALLGLRAVRRRR
jgi:hypothetical protein